MFTRKMLSATLVSLSLISLTGMAAAQGRANKFARLKETLVLTAPQVNEIRGLLKKHQQTAFPLRRELRVRNLELRNALETPEPNPASVGQLFISKHALNSKLRALKLKLRSDIAAVLTPEQRQKYEQMKPRNGKRAIRGLG